MSSRSAVSDVIGYIIIFTVVIVGVALIYVISMPMVEKAQDDAKFSNMVSGFSVLRSDLDMVALSAAPIKTLSFNTAEGYFYVDPQQTISESKMKLTLINATNSTDILLYNESTMGVIKYTYKGRVVAYENGGVFEGAAGSDSFVLREEPMVYVDRLLEPGTYNTVVSIINITGNFSSMGGAGTAKFVVSAPKYREIFNDSSMEVVLNITVESEFAGAWARHLEEQGLQNVTVSERQVTADILTKVIIGEHRIKVS